MPIALEELKAHLTSVCAENNIVEGKTASFDRMQAQADILSGEAWHRKVLRLVASYVARGLEDWEIQSICRDFTLEGYTTEQTVIEVQKMINGARAKGFAPPSIEGDPKDSVAKGPLLTLIGDVEKRDVNHLVDGILECKSLIGLVGASGCGKSFVAIDLAMCIATGTPFHGRNIIEGLVLMCVGEGHAGMPDRRDAWCMHHGLEKDKASLAITDRPADLFEEPYLERFYAETEKLTEQHGPLRLIVIDTVARHMPGMDENASRDMGEFIRAADKLKQDFSCAVMLVHHTGLSHQDRARGSSAFKAALDTEIILKPIGEHDISMNCAKQKDGPPFDQLQFLKVSVGKSLVLQEVAASRRKKENKLNTGEEFALNVLKATLNKVSKNSVHLDEWRKEFNRRHHGDNSKSKAQAFLRARESLARKGFVCVNNDYYSLGDKATK